MVCLFVPQKCPHNMKYVHCQFCFPYIVTYIEVNFKRTLKIH